MTSKVLDVLVGNLFRIPRKLKAIARILHIGVRKAIIGRAGRMTSGSQGSIIRSIGTLFSGGSVSGLADGQLLDRFLSQPNEDAEAAFTALVALHGPMVWGLPAPSCLTRTRSRMLSRPPS